jgi:hypothetical protein
MAVIASTCCTGRPRRIKCHVLFGASSAFAPPILSNLLVRSTPTRIARPSMGRTLRFAPGQLHFVPLSKITPGDFVERGPNRRQPGQTKNLAQGGASRLAETRMRTRHLDYCFSTVCTLRYSTVPHLLPTSLASKHGDSFRPKGDAGGVRVAGGHIHLGVALFTRSSSRGPIRRHLRKSPARSNEPPGDCETSRAEPFEFGLET